jgi:heme-degrading monooxygenase HmoA
MFVATRKVQVQPRRKQDFIDVWYAAIGTRLERQPGFITAWLLTSQHDDEVMIMSHWEHEADHRRWRQSDEYRQVHAHIGGLMRRRLGDKNYTLGAAIANVEPESSKGHHR